MNATKTSRSAVVRSITDRPISVVGARVVQAAVDPNVAIADLAALAERDPGFAARVLHIANSAAFGARAHVTDIRHGCALLGARGLRNVALGLIVSDMVPSGSEADVLIEIALRRAVAAKLVAAHLAPAQADEAFTVGLFLEAGLLVDARRNMSRAIRIARLPAADRPVVERAFDLSPHVLRSSRLAIDLGLPEAVSRAIAHHHDGQPETPGLATIAWVAERVAAAWEATDPVRAHDDAVVAMQQAGLDAAAISAIFEAVPRELTAAAESIQRSITEPVDLTALTADAQKRLLELNHGYENLVRRLEQLLDQKDALARELATANADLARLATQDPLTGLANRRAFDDALRRDLARASRGNEHLALVMLDVDHFKRLNDTFGHPVGDRVLAEVAATLRSTVRSGDLPARVGGEEFLTILPNTSTDNGVIVAERVRRALERIEVSTDHGVVRVTASFGVASIQGESSSERLLAAVDAALYRAKQGGRNRVVAASEV